MASFIQRDNERGYMTNCDGSDGQNLKSPWEIRCGKLITNCECIKRNGLQNECNIPNCANKTKKLYEITNNPKSSGDNEIHIKPTPQDASPKMTNVEQFLPQQNNVPTYGTCEIPSQVYQKTSPQPENSFKYQIPSQNLMPSAKLQREETEQRPDRIISAMIARQNALRDKEIICPEQCSKKLLDCNPLQGLDPGSKQYAQVQRSYFNSPQYNHHSPIQQSQQYNPLQSPNQQYHPANPYNPEQQYVLNHYESGGNSFPHHCQPSPPQGGSDPNQLTSHYESIPSNEMKSPRTGVENPSQYGTVQPAQFQLQPCCMHVPPKPCCQPHECCKRVVTGFVPTTESCIPPSNGDHITPPGGNNFYSGITSYQHQPSNIPHQHYHLPTNNGNILQQSMNGRNNHTRNQQLQSGNTTTVLNQPYINSQYPNNDQIYPPDHICNCNQNSPKLLSPNNCHDYERFNGGQNQNLQVDLVGNQNHQPQEDPIQTNFRSYVEPLIPEPQELSEYPPQIRKYRLDGKECN